MSNDAAADLTHAIGGHKDPGRDEYGIELPEKGPEPFAVKMVNEEMPPERMNDPNVSTIEKLARAGLGAEAGIEGILMDEFAPWDSEGHLKLPGATGAELIEAVRDSNHEDAYRKKREAAEAAAAQQAQLEQYRANQNQYKADIKTWQQDNGLPTDAEIYQAEQNGTSPHVTTDAAGNPQCVAPEGPEQGTPYSPYAGQYATGP